MTNDTAFTAYFEVIPTYTVTVNSNDDETGSVTGSGTYLYGTQVTITATPNDGCRFISWNDGSTETSRTVTVTADATYTDYFEVIPYYTITVLSNDEEMGYVSGGGIYQYGEQATFSATAREGYHFTHWSDGSTEATRSISITGDATYTAYFEVGGTEGIDDITAEEVRIYSRGSEIVIEGADNSDALVYDIMGRIVHKGRIENHIHVNNMGVYMVKIGNQKPQKVVVR